MACLSWQGAKKVLPLHPMKNLRPKNLIVALLLSAAASAQQLPTDGALTLRPLLQQLGSRLLQGKTGSIVAIRPQTGEIICLATNTPSGPNTAQAIAKAQAPGSTFKTAQALTLLSEGLISADTAIPCDSFFLDGNIRVGCHRHRSPLRLQQALAQSCNTWFISTFMEMINDRFLYDTREEAITVWREYMFSMGLGRPLGIDMPGEMGGLLASAAYLNRRFPNGWDGRTVLWAGMGQGDVTLTPLQLCNLAVTIANRGYYFPPHIHKPSAERPLAQRFLTPRHTKVQPEAYLPVVQGMRMAVTEGTARSINTSDYAICGKTGTVENTGRDHSAFIGFAPMDNPQIAIAVYIEHGGFGADLAAPTAALIIEEYLKGRLSAKSEAKAKRIASKRF